eukprot:4713890-Prymnesium_polylepis.1
MLETSPQVHASNMLPRPQNRPAQGPRAHGGAPAHARLAPHHHTRQSMPSHTRQSMPRWPRAEARALSAGGAGCVERVGDGG